MALLGLQCQVDEQTNISGLLEQPARETPIWRYMDFVRFLAMLERGLWLSRADLLGDPFEGSFTPKSVEAFLRSTGRPPADGRQWAEILKGLRQTSLVTCWHESDCESAALWSFYGNCIAITSTVGKLSDFLGSSYRVARVRYIDYRTQHPNIEHSMGPLLYKRHSFAHEREIRGITQAQTIRGGKVAAGRGAKLPGKYIKGDLNLLIDKILVAPQTPDWQRELTFSVARKYNLDKACFPSGLDLAPPSV